MQEINLNIELKHIKMDYSNENFVFYVFLKMAPSGQ